MEFVEIDCEENLNSPFCQKVLVDHDEDDFEICEHTIFVATDADFEFIREDYSSIKNQKLMEEGNYDEFTTNLNIEGGIRITQYNPAPSFFGVYFGFIK